MSKLLEKILPVALGAGAVGALDFLLVEGAGGAGVAYDLLNGGYMSDFLKTRDPRELLDLNELNVGEVTSLFAILASLAFLFFALNGKRLHHRVPVC